MAYSALQHICCRALINFGHYESPVEIFVQAIKHKCQQLLRVVLLKAVETWSILANSPLHTYTDIHIYDTHNTCTCTDRYIGYIHIQARQSGTCCLMNLEILTVLTFKRFMKTILFSRYFCYQCVQCIRGYFYNDIRYINLRFTYFLLTSTYIDISMSTCSSTGYSYE